MNLDDVTREQFIAAITAQDQFAKTFVAKADMQQLWAEAEGCWEGDELLGAIIVTLSKRAPKTANLQLLHTFAKHRRRGVGRLLCSFAIQYAYYSGYSYFRVSSEVEAVEFYRTLGIKFWGKQKSGCSLSIFQIGGPAYTDGIYNLADPVIQAALHSGRKGSLVDGGLSAE